VLLSLLGTIGVCAVVVVVTVGPTINTWHRLGIGWRVEIIGQHAVEVII